jgi:hypothetical protein
MMSRVSHNGVVGVKYWEYMAEVMAKCIDRAILGQRVKVPLGILYDALLFIKVVLGQKTGTFFDNHLARNSAHTLAWHILDDCQTLQSNTQEEVNDHFRRFAEFLKNLVAEPTAPFGKGGWCKQFAVPFDETNLKTAVDLRDFFVALSQKAAEKSRY